MSWCRLAHISLLRLVDVLKLYAVSCTSDNGLAASMLLYMLAFPLLLDLLLSMGNLLLLELLLWREFRTSLLFQVLWLKLE